MIYAPSNNPMPTTIMLGQNGAVPGMIWAMTNPTKYKIAPFHDLFSNQALLVFGELFDHENIIAN
jgi:hypothetical protein